MSVDRTERFTLELAQATVEVGRSQGVQGESAMRRRGPAGLLQSEGWRRLEASSRTNPHPGPRSLGKKGSFLLGEGLHFCST